MGDEARQHARVGVENAHERSSADQWSDATPSRCDAHLTQPSVRTRVVVVDRQSRRRDDNMAAKRRATKCARVSRDDGKRCVSTAIACRCARVVRRRRCDERAIWSRHVRLVARPSCASLQFVSTATHPFGAPRWPRPLRRANRQERPNCGCWRRRRR